MAKTVMYLAYIVVVCIWNHSVTPPKILMPTKTYIFTSHFCDFITNMIKYLYNAKRYSRPENGIANYSVSLYIVA